MAEPRVHYKLPSRPRVACNQWRMVGRKNTTRRDLVTCKRCWSVMGWKGKPLNREGEHG